MLTIISRPIRTNEPHSTTTAARQHEQAQALLWFQRRPPTPSEADRLTSLEPWTLSRDTSIGHPAESLATVSSPDFLTSSHLQYIVSSREPCSRSPCCPPTHTLQNFSFEGKAAAQGRHKASCNVENVAESHTCHRENSPEEADHSTSELLLHHFHDRFLCRFLTGSTASTRR